MLTLILLLNTAGIGFAAGICNPNTITTHYKAIYCGMRLNNNEAADDDILKTLAAQFNMDKDIVKEILAGTICATVAKQSDSDKAKLPQAVKDACLDSGISTEQAVGGWSIFTDIRNAYEKEKIIRASAASLKFKFKASEQYWDGKVRNPGNPNDAPFDLIVDLNLIEIVLFGSKAQWMQDVYSFPSNNNGGGGQTPTGTQPPAGGAGNQPATPKPAGGGVTVSGGETKPGTTPSCVPPTDPNADTGSGPGSNHTNPLCGNGKVDVLMGEQCDDGNTVSGDGCSQYCRKEIAGSNDQCVDPEAVTFQNPPQTGGAASNTGGTTGTGTPETSNTGSSNQTAQCPPGTVPSKTPVSEAGTEQNLPPTVAQSPEYPGPSVGGTLKQYPESTPPACHKDEIQIGTNSDGTPHCVPGCASFDDARDFLFGKGWKDDKVLSENATAIEALFCIKLTKANRPLSPYQTNEGCIDCHISAMADALDKALQTNVTPLTNTTQAFSISSKYGPNFSFNLNTAAKGILKYQFSDTAQTAIEKSNQDTANIERNDTPPQVNVPATETPLVQLQQQVQQDAKVTAAIQDDTSLFHLSSDVIADQEVGGRIVPLLTQMRDSFANIEDKFEQMVGTSHLDEVQQCKP